MNLKLLGLATVTTLPLLSVAGAAHADDCRSAVSMIQLPNRTCVDLSYLTRLGASRRGVSLSEQSLRRAIQVHQHNDVLVTDIAGNGSSFIATATSRRENPTAELQSIKEGLLADASIGYRQAVSANERIEETAFRHHMRAMNRIEQAFTRR